MAESGSRKLSLNRETVRQLDPEDLSGVVGGQTGTAGSCVATGCTCVPTPTNNTICQITYQPRCF